MATNGGHLLLILAGAAAQTAAQLTAASGLSPTETLHQLTRLVAHGFIVVGTPAGAVAVYQLNPKGVRTEVAAPHRRILLIEDDAAVQELLTMVLEEEGYALILTRVPADAESLLREVAFDLVITDSLSPTPAAVLASTTNVLAAAGVTPVALFTAHQVELDAARAAGFADLFTKPFDLATLERQVRALLPSRPGAVWSGPAADHRSR
jgi:CheY-like chemotaxis protein